MLEDLQRDTWRQQVGFSREMSDVQDRLYDDCNDANALLSGWIQKFQPCLFGRVAAKLNLLRFCVLRENDLERDERVSHLIQAARLRWKKEAIEGKASGFLVVLVSRRIAEAIPNEAVARIARRLCSLYLHEVEAEFDVILHERLWLERSGPETVTWEWLAGVNYFCAQGDRRWWQDHRIPGGMAFSVNSVGHMAKAGKLSELMGKMDAELGIADADYGHGTIRTLEDALKYAMLTIENASEAVSGRATNLIDVPGSNQEYAPALPTCPIELPRSIKGKNHCVYHGWYHTDFTLPKEYFRSAVERGADVRQHDLDFTYLFLDSVDNPALETMGRGQRIRAETGEAGTVTEDKRHRLVPRELSRNDRAAIHEYLGI